MGTLTKKIAVFTIEMGFIVFPFKKGMDLYSMIHKIWPLSKSNPIVWLKLVLILFMEHAQYLEKLINWLNHKWWMKFYLEN